ncbi:MULTISPECIES: restriction endonuclease subunit S [Vibrio]|uniref:restriction endonuclease subunit S n=1 Tax=Vibrio TaxID=662 RepID=UPI000503910B|nr:MULTISPECIES: restriction endonuclease subunit S [Vibrio]EGR0350113.1 restriction endonuclease subunit S [Vibrio vulnificus]EHH3081027.1 restriction endonuclease subunit S [Vibrio vulnificus]EHU4916964.1 restriction endonuclease subunit S [Vibrio vulnificus]EID0059897.1 restriction endonuclease subunit S [Vibrio vulnificus]EID0716801.1 restriction endonuclease subunit S [Vibrio vulnificus]
MKNITEMSKYEYYKHSGYEWIGEIPIDWEVYKLRLCLTPVSEKNHPNLPLLSITRELGVIERDIYDQESNHNFIPDDLSSYKLLKKGQFGMNKMKAWQGSYGVSKYTGIVSPAYYVFDLVQGINPEFFHWAIRSKIYVSFFGSASDGVRIGQWDLSKNRMKDIPFVFPEKQQQKIIAKFLDKKAAEIDEAILIKEQQIELFKDQKQITIQKAVTQGLDRNVVMKDSGFEWVGKIPATWEISKLGRCLSAVSVKNHPDLPLLSITRELGVIERDTDDKKSNHNFIPDDLSGYKLIKKGQFGMNKMKAWQGSYGVSKYTGIVSPAYYVFDLVQEINPEFFHWAIRSKLYVSYFASASDGVRIGQWDLSKTRMKDIPFIYPDMNEQRKIASYLEEQVSLIELTISELAKNICKLREYKTSLINHAVTGKTKIMPEMVEG